MHQPVFAKLAIYVPQNFIVSEIDLIINGNQGENMCGRTFLMIKRRVVYQIKETFNHSLSTVSYTHLDVYKRQILYGALSNNKTEFFGNPGISFSTTHFSKFVYYSYPHDNHLFSVPI